MRIFPSPLHISDTEGFTPEKDLFGRHELGIGLTNLLGSVAEPMVIAIDGQWGTGKTTFLKMWAGHLRQQGFPVIYFDAFENDYVDDAFAALAAEIVGLVDAERKSSEPKAKEFKAKAIGALKVLGRSAIKVGVKAGSMGALDATTLGDDIVEAISSEAEELTDKHIGELLTKQAEGRNTLQAFRDALRDLPGILAPAPEPLEGEQAARPKPLIFMIDELDRCKPLFALQLLERIKHFFAVPNVHFVLGTHMGQLRNSVNAAYGANINANTYLQKFISLTFPLVDASEHRHERLAVKYVDKLRRDLNITPDDRDFAEGVSNFVKTYALLHHISLRDIEHVMTNIAVSVAFTKKNHFRPHPLIAGLAILRVAQPALYVQAKRGTLRYEDVVKALSLDHQSAERDEDRSYSEFSQAFWEYALKKDADQALVNRFDSGMGYRFSFGRHGILKFLANSVVDRLIADP